MPHNLRMSRALTGENGIQVSIGEVFSFPTHSHAYCEMILYHPFGGSVKVNDTTITGEAPFALLMTPSDLHSITLTGDTSEFIKIAFRQDILSGYIASRLTVGRLTAPVPADHAVARLFEKMLSLPHHEDRVILLQALLLLMIDEGVPLPSLPAARTGSLVAEATGIIGDEFQAGLTLEELARRLNVSYQHLSASFKKHLGLSFSAYLCDIRLRHAKALLQDPALSVTEVCYACGYRNLSHFLRSFKKKFGVTPKESRKC